jgi:hypothetical protein
MILFAGGEREALAQGPVGTYAESAYATATGRAQSSNTGTGSYYDFPFSEAVSEVWLHFGRMYNGFDDGINQPPIEFRDAGGNVIARLRNVAASQYGLEYWNGAAFVLLGGTKPFAGNVRHIYDVRIKKHATDGAIEWYFDGVLMGAATGIALSSFGDISYVRCQHNGGTNFYWSVIASTERTLDWQLWVAPPTANGTDTDGTGVVGDVNELNLNTATFVELAVAGEKRSFVHTALTTSNFIKGVAVASVARRVDGTGPQQIRPYVIIGGVRYYGTTYALTVSFARYEHVWQLSPASGTDWTTAEVNAAGFEMGWEAVA